MKTCVPFFSAVVVLFSTVAGCTNAAVDDPVGRADASIPRDVAADLSEPDSPVIINLDALPTVDADCTAGGPGCPSPVCGNGNIQAGEDCDDGNATSGDGCSTACKLESDWICPTPGKACVSTVVCNDNRISGNEQCDDGNTVEGDGCSSKCQLEAGWTCPVLGSPCVAKSCGDGIPAGSEQCDDGNTASDDGCSATCQLEPGHACGPNQWHPDATIKECYKTACGDGHLEGTEQCDDGNTKPFDGCTPGCTNEPTCGYPDKDPKQSYQCFSVCGDGIKMPDEACDDGNVQSGDGCSSKCLVEKGFVCLASAPALGKKLTVPILYRDFSWRHPQFEVEPVSGQRLPGIAASAIGVDRKPVYNSAFVAYDGAVSLERPSTMDGPAMSTSSRLMSDAAGTTFRTKPGSGKASLTVEQIAEAYAQWYTDDPKATGDPAVDAANPDVTRITIQDTLGLDELRPGTYQYYSSAFFPLDKLGFGNINDPATDPTYVHNYGFTSEAHYWFQYNGGETLEFRGDDDVWVFVNGQLAVDLGGIHNELRGIVTLNGAETSVCVDDTSPRCAGEPVCDTPPPANCTTVASGYNLTAGNIYEIIVFQAERHVVASNYKLTLSGFNAPKSTCRSECGDGIVTKGEACDLGEAGNTGAYGTCNPDCTLPPRCGDGTTQAPNEECDNGVNLASYGQVGGCAPGCRTPPYCGDRKIDSAHEECDEGPAGGGLCTKDCKAIIP